MLFLLLNCVNQTLSSANPADGNDAFQRIIKEKHDANIMFLIQQANVAQQRIEDSQRHSTKKVAEINADTKNYKLNNIEISAYASPDGGVELNTFG